MVFSYFFIKRYKKDGGSFRRLEIIDGLDTAQDLCGITDIVHDLVYALVGHGRFIQGIGNHASGIDARHFGLILRHGKLFKSR